MLLQSSQENDPVLERFYNSLPKAIRCGNGKELDWLRDKSEAYQTADNIQLRRAGGRGRVHYLAFDIDHRSAALRWYDTNTPQPTIISQNLTNGHCHYLYELAYPVAIGSRASEKAENYLRSIRHGLTERLGADFAYSGYSTKNPNSSRWRVWVNDVTYQLAELAEYVDDSCFTWEGRNTRIGMADGRNCALFEKLRLWAYARVQKALDSYTYNQWEQLLLSQCDYWNRFTDTDKGSLPFSEVKSISKSIARWTWTKYTGASVSRTSKTGKNGQRIIIDRGRDMAALSATCSDKDRQVYSATVTNRQRKEKSLFKIEQAVGQLKTDGVKVSKPKVSKLSGVSLSTVKRHWATLKEKGLV